VGAVQQAVGQLRLGGEHHLLRDTGQVAVFLIPSAALRQVQCPADQRMPAAGGVGQGDRDLVQRDTAHRAAVLAGRPGRVGGGFLIGGLVHDQDRIPVIELRNRPGRRRIQDLLVVPDRPRQQMLQPVRATVPGRLGEAPAVVALQLHQQPIHHLTGGLPGLPTRKTPRHLLKQVSQQGTSLVIR
jgi:hypothetical protein